MTTTPSAPSGQLGSASRKQRRLHWVDSLWVGVVAPLVAVGVIVGLWQIAALFVNPILISSPGRVVTAFGFLISSGALWAGLEVSLREMYAGLAIGLALGIILGLLIGRYRLASAVLAPFVNAVNATPLIVAIPLVVIWLGVNGKARLFFIVLISMWPVLLNTMAGMRNVRKGYMEVGTTFGLNERSLMRKIAIPATVPYMLAGARISCGLAIIGMVVAEMEVSTAGLGYLLTIFGNGFQTGRLLSLVLTTAVLGVINVGMLRLVERRFFRWVSTVGS